MNPGIPSIDQLKELSRLPAPVSYMPQTWGWWVLLGVLVLAIALVSARKVWQWRRDRYRREALVRLAQLQSRSNDLAALRELPELLKRVALSIPPVGAGLLAKTVGHSTSVSTDTASSRASPLPQGPAALGGVEWQAFLQQHSAQPLPSDFSQQLAHLAYAPDARLLELAQEQRQQIFNTCKTWVETHHVAA